jgi:hypothetical protein
MSSLAVIDLNVYLNSPCVIVQSNAEMALMNNFVTYLQINRVMIRLMVAANTTAMTLDITTIALAMMDIISTLLTCHLALT